MKIGIAALSLETSLELEKPSFTLVLFTFAMPSSEFTATTKSQHVLREDRGQTIVHTDRHRQVDNAEARPNKLRIDGVCPANHC